MADHRWRYYTTNDEYGKFYDSIRREVNRDDQAHRKCTQKVHKLSEELREAKACLEMVSLGGPLAIKRLCGSRGLACKRGAAGLPTSPRMGDCHCDEKPPTICDNPYRSVNTIEYNGGMKHEPQFLEDHIKCYHPRLVKRLVPKIDFRHLRPDSARGQSRGRMEDCVPQLRRGMSPRSRGGGGNYSEGCTPTLGGRGRRYLPAVVTPPTLPPSQRYNFYKYYGFAGQGAKTSKGWHSRV